MITQQTVLNELWPLVERLIEATATAEDPTIRRHLTPRGQAAAIHDLHGPIALEILLKTILLRDRLALTRAIETESDRNVHIEYLWLDPEAQAPQTFTAADLVTVTLRPYRDAWRVQTINPAGIQHLLTEERALSLLITSQAVTGEQTLPQEPWVLPLALYAGALQLPLRDQALADPIERHLLPGLQARGYGIISLVNARKLWRDFRKKAMSSRAQPRDHPGLEAPAVWAAAVEQILGALLVGPPHRDQPQAATAQAYKVPLSALLPRVRQIKETLNIQPLDERYSPLAQTHIVLEDETASGAE